MNESIRLAISLVGVAYLFYYLWNRWVHMDQYHKKDLR
jgi:hypothetical protein